MDVPLHPRSSLASRLLLGAALGWTGCASAPRDPTVALAEPPAPSFVDRVLRRQPSPAQYSQAIEEAPRDPKDPARLSLVYAQLMERSGQLDQASSHYNKALDENPSSVDALIGLGRVHTLAGRHEQAEKSLLKALEHDPRSTAALHALGQSYAARNRWDEAVATLERAALLQPEDQSLQYDLAVAFVQAGDIDSALPCFARTVGEAEAHYNVGLILQRAGRLTESEQQFRMALARKPDFEQARYWLATLHQQQTLPAAPPNAVLPVSYQRPTDSLPLQSPVR